VVLARDGLHWWRGARVSLDKARRLHCGCRLVRGVGDEGCLGATEWQESGGGVGCVGRQYTILSSVFLAWAKELTAQRQGPR